MKPTDNHTKNHVDLHIPFEISEYLTKNFHHGFHSDIKMVMGACNIPNYLVTIDQDEVIYHLKFDARGQLISSESATILDNDNDDDLNSEA